MERKELLKELPGKRIYATDEPMLLWTEFTGAYGAFHTSMHCFLMKGLAESEVSCTFAAQASETEFVALKGLEIPMTLSVLTGGETPVYSYAMDGVAVSRNRLLEGTVIEEALLNIEDTGRYIWDILSEYFGRHGIKLGQIDLHFAHIAEHFIVLCGDLTPETMHLMDPETGKRLWNGEGGMENSYEIILARMRA